MGILQSETRVNTLPREARFKKVASTRYLRRSRILRMDDKTRATGPEPLGNAGSYLAPKSSGLKVWIVVFLKAGTDPHRIGLNSLDAGDSH